MVNTLEAGRYYYASLNGMALLCIFMVLFSSLNGTVYLPELQPSMVWQKYDFLITGIP